jgi:hypothetical protein
MATLRLEELPLYIYQPLPIVPARESSTYFWLRVFVLKPGQFDDQISGLVRAYESACKPPDTALSYSWGTDKYDGVIAVDRSFRLHVTTNLEAALRRSRHFTEQVTLWVDYICTDQDNPSERGHQV